MTYKATTRALIPLFVGLALMLSSDVLAQTVIEPGPPGTIDEMILGDTTTTGERNTCHYVLRRNQFYIYNDEVLSKPVPIRVYHDIILYQEMMDHGRAEPLAPGLFDRNMESHPAMGVLSPALTEMLFSAHLQRSLVDLHSFTDTEQELDTWLTRYFERLEPLYVDMDRYARYYHETDLDAIRRFILDPNFYDRNDPIIALARSVQRGQADESIDFDAAMTAADRKSVV